MPALSPTMSQGNLTSWKVKEGDQVEPGTVLAEVETDKATLEWENQVPQAPFVMHLPSLLLAALTSQTGGQRA